MSLPLHAQRSDAERLLTRIAPGGLVTFQTFDDRSAKIKRRSLIRILHGSFVQHAVALEKLNTQGAGIFFMVNGGDGKGRAAKNVEVVRALFVDLDGSPIEPVLKGPLEPHLAVESSPGRFHAYWLVKDIPLDQFTHLQTMLAERFNGDRHVKDLCRVMRLPGFWHRKGEPHLTKVIHEIQALDYQFADLIRAFEVVHTLKTVPGEIPEGTRNDRLLKLAAGLFRRGIPGPEIEERIRKVNLKQCIPPLDTEEVIKIIESASRYQSTGFTMIPYEVIDSPVFRSLSMGAICLLVHAYRRYNGSNNGNISLTHSEFRQLGFPDAKRFGEKRIELVKAGFLRITREARYGKKGQSKRCALYAISRVVEKSP